MAPVALFIFLLVTHLMVLPSAEQRCPPYFECKGIKAEIYHFPFRTTTGPPECGLYPVSCSDGHRPKIQLIPNGYWLEVETLETQPYQLPRILINDTELQKDFQSQKDSCDDELFHHLSLPIPSPTLDVLFSTHNLTLFKCHTTPDQNNDGQLCLCKNDRFFYHETSPHSLSSPPPPNCSKIQIPINPDHRPPYTLSALTCVFYLELLLPTECYGCHERKGECLVEKGKYKCLKVYVAGDQHLPLKLGLGLGLGCSALLAVLFLLWRYKQKRASNFLSRNISSQPYSNSDHF